MRTARSARWLAANATGPTAGAGDAAAATNGAALLPGGLHVLGLRLLQLVDARACMLDAMPCHLQHLGGRVAGTFVRLASRHLRQVVDLFGELRLDGAQRLEEHLRVALGVLLAGLLFAELLERLTWRGLAYAIECLAVNMRGELLPAL